MAAFLSFSVSALKKGTSCRSAISNSIPSLGACDFINLRADLRGRGASTESQRPTFILGKEQVSRLGSKRSAHAEDFDG